jgi:hypothetical protein
MQQQLIFKTETAQVPTTSLSFNLPDVDGLLPGFKAGDFAVIHGPRSLPSLITNLCIRAQLPQQLGGLESKVVFVDAANSSALPDFLQAAELKQLDPKTVLENLISMRAYTAYRLTSLITEKLEEAVEASKAKLVVVSDIVGPFLSEIVNDQEAKAVYSQIMSYLAGFAKRHKIIVIATCLPHESSTRNSTLQEITSAKAKIVLRFTKTPYTSEVELEKHPTYMLGVAEFSETNRYDSNVENGRNPVPTLTYRIL